MAIFENSKRQNNPSTDRNLPQTTPSKTRKPSPPTSTHSSISKSIIPAVRVTARGFFVSTRALVFLAAPFRKHTEKSRSCFSPPRHNAQKSTRTRYTPPARTAPENNPDRPRGGFLFFVFFSRAARTKRRRRGCAQLIRFTRVLARALPGLFRCGSSFHVDLYQCSRKSERVRERERGKNSHGLFGRVLIGPRAAFERPLDIILRFRRVVLGEKKNTHTRAHAHTLPGNNESSSSEKAHKLGTIPASNGH